MAVCGCIYNKSSLYPTRKEETMHSNPTRKAMTRWSSLCGAVLFAIGVFSAPTIASAKCVNYVSPMQTKTITSAGQNTTFYFSGLPATSGRTAVAVIDLYGDFDYSSEYADIYINSTLVGQHNPTGGQCNTSLQYGNNSTRGFVLPGFTGGTVSVRVDASASVGSWCSGSSTDRIVVKIMYVQTNCTSVCSSSTFNKITSPNPVCLLHNPDKPYCAGSTCRECPYTSAKNNATCSAVNPDTPHCLNYKCVQCQADADCPSTYSCDKTSGKCVCPSGNCPKICNASNSTNQNSFCKAADPSKPYCYNKLCRECPFTSLSSATSYNCPGNKRSCINFECRECPSTNSTNNVYCTNYVSSKRPHCKDYNCVECTSDSHCSGGKKCISNKCEFQQSCSACVTNSWCASNQTTGSTCGAGRSICRADGLCVECTTNAHCQNGQICNSINRCANSASCPSTCSSDADCLKGNCGTRTRCLSGKCSDVSTAAQCQPPNLLVILDKSCSMGPGYGMVDSFAACAGTSSCVQGTRHTVQCNYNSSLGFKTCRYSRWDTAVIALKDVFKDFGGTKDLNYLDRKVRFGLEMFDSNASIKAPIFKDPWELNAKLDAFGPGGGTNYERAFSTARSHINTTYTNDPVKRRKTAVLFITDGAPNEGCAWSRSPSQVDQLYNYKPPGINEIRKIKSYIVGFGNSLQASEKACLDTLAQAGRTEIKTCKTGSCLKHYAANNAAGLRDAFIDIINNATAEECDGLDNDCNGQIDEGNPGGTCNCVKSFTKPNHSRSVQQGTTDYNSGVRLYTYLTSFSNQGTCPVHTDPTQPSHATQWLTVCRNDSSKALSCNNNAQPAGTAMGFYCGRCCNDNICTWSSTHLCTDYPWVQSATTPVGQCINNCKSWCAANQKKALQCLMPVGYVTRIGTGYLNGSTELKFQTEKEAVEFGALLAKQKDNRNLFVYLPGDDNRNSGPLNLMTISPSGSVALPTGASASIPTRYAFVPGNNQLKTSSMRTLMDITNCTGSECTQEVEFMVNMIRGAQGGTVFRDHPLGPIYNSNPITVPPPTNNINDETFRAWLNEPIAGGVAKVSERPTIVYVGSNDGIIHAFLGNAQKTSSFVELWGFIPKTVVSKLRHAVNGSMPEGGKVYTADGTPVVKNIQMYRYDYKGATTVKWRTVMVTNLRAGGRGYVAMDVTDPYRPKLLWEINSGSYFDPKVGGKKFDKMGYTFAQPFIAKVLVNWPNDKDGTKVVQERAVAILAGGSDIKMTGALTDLDVNSPIGGVVYVVDLETGILMQELVPDTQLLKAAGEKAVIRGFTGTPTGFGAPPAITSRAFVGDAIGRLFRVDLQSTNPNEWEIHFFYNLFKNENYTKPIMVAPALALNPNGELVIFGGTGNLFQLDSVLPGHNKIFSVREYIDPAKAIDFATGRVKPDAVEAIHNYRASLNKILVFAKKDSDTHSKIDKTPAVSPTGEKVTGDPIVYNNTAYFTTYTPSSDLPICGVSGMARMYAIGYGEPCKSNRCSPLVGNLFPDTQLKCCEDGGGNNCTTAGAAVTDASLLANRNLCASMDYVEPRYFDESTTPAQVMRQILLGRNALAMGVNLTFQPGQIAYSRDDNNPRGEVVHKLSVQKRGSHMVSAWPAGRNRAADSGFLASARVIKASGDDKTNFYALKTAKQPPRVIVSGWGSLFDQDSL
ncbi:MAG: hypothetical protein CL920_04300 [Deltaproteobacteria bacterium]|nr:hypothetical protein [Deltaproteobacteria bacterium]MBU47898.1 hypothetical protein [Deltaproteobacteria bacterium]